MTNDYWESENEFRSSSPASPYTKNTADGGQRVTGEVYSHTFEPSAKPLYGADASPKKEGRRHSVGIVILCVVLSTIFSFGGTFVANRFFPPETQSSIVVAEESSPQQNTASSSSANSLSAVIENISDTVVEITTESVSTGSFLGQYVAEGAGSGVVIRADGYIVTNNHVVSGAGAVKVRLTDGTSYTATVIGTDAKSDIAVLKVDASGLHSATVGNSDGLKVGDDVIAIGNPLGSLGGTVTNGIISALDREIEISGQIMTLLQTNAAVNPGNSGGGLFDSNGNLIGIVNAKSSGTDIEGLGFAVPINLVLTVVEDIIENGYVTGRPAMGISVYEVSNAQTAQQYGVTRYGVYIMTVNDGSGAKAAGLMVGDYIVSVNDTAVEKTSDVTSVIDGSSIGDVIKVQVIRGNKTLTFNVELMEQTPVASKAN